MLIFNYQCALFKNKYCLQDSRAVFKDPEDSGDSAGSDKESWVGTPYAFGDKFDLERELGNENISKEAYDFIKRWPVIEGALRSIYEATLKGFYEYDAYTYIHTVQMLNLVCGLTDEEFAKITEAIRVPEKKDERFDFDEADFRDMFTGELVLHDLGKMGVDIKVLNHPGSLRLAMRNEMNSHPMRTTDMLISKIFDGIDSDIGMKDLLHENRLFRESNNTASYLLDETDKLIVVDEVRKLVKSTKSTECIDTQSQPFTEAMSVIFKIDPAKAWELRGGMKKVNEAISIADNDSKDRSRKDLKQILDGIINEDIDLNASMDIISEKNPDKAEDMRDKMQIIVAAPVNERSKAAAKVRFDVERIVSGIKKTNDEPMKKVQAKIKEPINNVLKGSEHSKERQLFHMVYPAVSHHNSSGSGYPSLEDLSGILPGYKKWFDSSGREQATILAIFDIADAMFSERAYKEPRKYEVVERALTKDFLCRKGSEERCPALKKYESIVQFALERWKKMKGADAYTKMRKEAKVQTKTSKKD